MSASNGYGDERICAKEAASRCHVHNPKLPLMYPGAVQVLAGPVVPHRRDCVSAIAFALEGDPCDYDNDAETLTFDVNVAPAA